LMNGKDGAPVAEAMQILGKEICVERFGVWLALADEGRLGLDFMME